METRVEKDFIGEMQLPADALYGIQSIRARENFPDQSPFQRIWYQTMGTVKLACYQTVSAFQKALKEKYPDQSWAFRLPEPDTLQAMEQAAIEISRGEHFDHFIVPAVSGGAGTSINMNINEIIANRSHRILKSASNLEIQVDPIEDANIFQSTNDTVPTALRIACMMRLQELETAVNTSRAAVEALENRYRNTLRIAYTQMQEAVPSSWGKLFSTYSDMLSRDWWRVSKCFERIKTVNLGGGAIGTGLGIPRFFIMEVNQNLQKLTNLPLSKAENLSDATANLDAFAEIHATLKAHAVNIEKMMNDLRLLASDVHGRPEISIPQKQIGSTIMPAKVNPVIPEFGISVAHKVYANDQLISSLCGLSCLELNAYLPLIGDALLNSLQLLIQANSTITLNLLSGLTVHADVSLENLYRSPAVSTALSPYIGYHKAAELARYMKENQCTLSEANSALHVIDTDRLNQVLQPDNLLKSGFTVQDLSPNL